MIPTIADLLIIFVQTGEIKALAGVDFLTIAPALLEQLKNDNAPVPKKLDAEAGEYKSSTHA